MARSPLDVITDDLSWREAELGSLKLILSKGDLSDHQKGVLLRASWALLYAHYEGFSKTSLTIFYDFAKKSVTKCRDLPAKTRLLSLRKKLKAIRNSSDENMLDAIGSFNDKYYDSPPSFPEVDTQSNLWPNVLEDILNDADLKVDALENHRVKISTLVNRRNNIAHGSRDIVSDISYYHSFESAVYELMYELALKIDERLKASPYI